MKLMSTKHNQGINGTELFISDSGFPSEGGREIKNRKSKIQNAKEGSGEIKNRKSKIKNEKRGAKDA